MKKASLVSTILAIVAFACAAAGLIFLIIDWKEFKGANNIKFYTFAFTIATGLLLFFTRASKNKYLIIPVAIACVLVGSYFISYMIDATRAVGMNVSGTPLDKFMMYNNGDTTFLQLILFAFFVTSLVLSVKFKYKWAIIVIISYVSIMILGVLKYLPEYLTDWDIKVYTFASLALLFTYVTVIVYFSQFFFKECECSCEAKEAKVETTEEVKAEETQEETKAEPETTEEKVEETSTSEENKDEE